jgi:hypothetical protein
MARVLNPSSLASSRSVIKIMNTMSVPQKATPMAINGAPQKLILMAYTRRINGDIAIQVKIRKHLNLA